MLRLCLGSAGDFLSPWTPFRGVSTLGIIVVWGTSSMQILRLPHPGMCTILRCPEWVCYRGSTDQALRPSILSLVGWIRFGAHGALVPPASLGDHQRLPVSPVVLAGRKAGGHPSWSSCPSLCCSPCPDTGSPPLAERVPVRPILRTSRLSSRDTRMPGGAPFPPHPKHSRSQQCRLLQTEEAKLLSWDSSVLCVPRH